VRLVGYLKENANFIFCDTVNKILTILLHWNLTSQEEVYVINYYIIAKQIRIYYMSRHIVR